MYRNKILLYRLRDIFWAMHRLHIKVNFYIAYAIFCRQPQGDELTAADIYIISAFIHAVNP